MENANPQEEIKPALTEVAKLAPANTTDGSQIFGVSVRGILTIIVISTVCAMAIEKIEVTEPLRSLAGMIVAFYFGHQVGKASVKP